MTKRQQLRAMIIMEFLNTPLHIINRSVLRKKYWAYHNAEEFDEVLGDLGIAGIIQAEKLGNDVMCTMPQSQVEDFKRLFKSKS